MLEHFVFSQEWKIQSLSGKWAEVSKTKNKKTFVERLTVQRSPQQLKKL